LTHFLHPVVKGIHHVEIVLLVKGDARRPVELPVAAAVPTEAAQVMTMGVEDADAVDVLVGQEKLAFPVEGDAGDPDKLTVPLAPATELVYVVALLGAFSYAHCFRLVGVGPAGDIQQVVRPQGQGYRVAESRPGG
jgi:hypothetical protein